MDGTDEDRDLARAGWSIVARFGGLWNRSDIQAQTGLSRQRVHQLVAQATFPPPATKVGGQPVWLAADVRAYRDRRAPNAVRTTTNDRGHDIR